VPELELAAIVQRSGEAAAMAYPDVTVYRSVEDLLASDVELIVVGTPNATHFPFAKQALQAGKHVVVDKPFAPSSSEAKELESIAVEGGLVLAPFHNRRWDGDFLTLKEIIADGNVGRVSTLESHFDRFRPLPRVGTWKEAEGSENGMLMDLGPHLVDQALVLFGRPESITASVRSDRDSSGIEDAFDITLRFTHQGNPLLVHARATMLAAEPAPRFRVHGTLGSFVKWGLDPQEPTIAGGAKVPSLSDTAAIWLAEPESAWGTLTTAPDPAKPETLERRKVPTARGDYRGYYRNIASAILGEGELAVTARDGFRAIRLLELARESSKAGCTLQVNDGDW